MKTIALAILACLPVFAAGTVGVSINPIGPQTSPSGLPETRVHVITITWVGDSVTGSVPSTSVNVSQFPQLSGYRLVSIEIQPGTPSPSVNYSVTLTDAAGIDLLAGNGANLSATVASYVGSLLSPPLITSPTFALTGNSVASAKGTITLFFAPLSQVAAARGLPATLPATQTFTGNNTMTGTTTHSGPMVNTGTDSGNQTISGNKTFSGTTTLSGPNVITGTDTGTQTVSGNKTFTGTDVLSGPLSITGTDSGTQTISGSKTFTTQDSALLWVMTRSGGAIGFPDITGNGSQRLMLGDANGVGVGTAGANFTIPGSGSGISTLQAPSTGGVISTMPSIAGTLVATGCSTSQRTENAADSNLLTCAIPAQAGSYRIRFILDVSAANTATLGWTATWTDSNSSAEAPPNLSLFQNGVAAPALTFVQNGGTVFYGAADVSVNNSGTSIVVKLTFSGTSFTAKASASVERII